MSNQLLDALAALNGPGHRCTPHITREPAPKGREYAHCAVCRRQFEKPAGHPRWFPRKES